MEIAQGIHRITVGQGAAPGLYATNTYMVIGSQGAAFVDTGWNREEDIKARLDYIRQMGNPAMKGIAITHRHPDHMGGASAIHQATGGPIITSPVEKAPIEAALKDAKVDKVVQDGETLSLGNMTLEFVHAPGHTLGSMAVFIREKKALFTGDNVMGTGTSVVNPGEGDIALYLQTMEKFLRYSPEVIYPGHGPVVKDTRAKLQGLINHRNEREQQVLGLLQKGPRSVEEMLKAIYDELDERVQTMARNQIRSHLAKLEKEGKVTATGTDTYRLR
ncbi:MAG: MBL fold metallo-hydrolase [Chloroflexi bacterium]|nr:MBL fold metallo-hydrolase [Chloroflexota bacterium]